MADLDLNQFEEITALDGTELSYKGTSPFTAGSNNKKITTANEKLFYKGSSIYAGNPNGNVAGELADMVFDSVDKLFWVCITAGNAGAAIWYPSPTPYPFVVGSTGNYAYTPDGLQAAVSGAFAASGGSPYIVFIQPGKLTDMGMGGPVTCPGSPNFVGSVSEMPPNAVVYEGGTFVALGSSDIPNIATTIMDCQLVFSDPNATITFYNMVWASNNQQRFFEIPDGNSTTTFSFKNAWVYNASGQYMVSGENHVSGNSFLILNLDNSYINAAGVFMDVENPGSGSVNIVLNFANSILLGNVSDLFNANITLTRHINSGSLYIDALSLDGDQTNVQVVDDLSDCTIGLTYGQAYLAGDGVTNNYVLSQNNVRYIGDSTSTNVAVFSNVGGVTINPASSISGVGLSLYNCNWGSLADSINAVYEVQDNGNYRTPRSVFSQTVELMEGGYRSSIIDGTTTGATKLATVNNPNFSSYCPTGILFYLAGSNTLTGQPTVSIGTNSPNYDNILSATLLTLTATRKYTYIPIVATTSSISAASTDIFINVQIASSALGYSFQSQILGTFF